jgi:hypothetical protein
MHSFQFCWVLFRKGGVFWIFYFFFVRYSTLLHLPHWLSDALTTRLGLIHKLFKTFKHSLSIYNVKKYALFKSGIVFHISLLILFP